MSLNFDCPVPMAPDTVNCSGRGIGCINEQCICENGWIGQGDFVSGSPACQLNVVGVQVVWGALLVGHVLNFFLAVYFLFVRSQKKKLTQFTDKITMIGILSLLTSASLLSLGFVRVTDPTRTIGTDPAATILFSVSSIGFWTVTPLMLSSFNNLLIGGLKGRNEDERHRIERFIRTFSRALPIGWILAMIASIAPSFILINPSEPNIMFGFAVVHFVILAINLAICWVIIHTLLRPILTDLSSALTERPDERLKTLEWKLKRFQTEVRNQALFQAISAGIFGCWPYAQRFSSYEVPIAWLGSAPIMAVAMIALMPSKAKPRLLGGTSRDTNNTAVGANGTLSNTPGTAEASFAVPSVAH